MFFFSDNYSVDSVRKEMVMDLTAGKVTTSWYGVPDPEMPDVVKANPRNVANAAALKEMENDRYAVEMRSFVQGGGRGLFSSALRALGWGFWFVVHGGYRSAFYSKRIH